MPQLDQVSFLSQFFWLCVFFLGFYVVLLKSFLPALNRILRFRSKLQPAKEADENFVYQYRHVLELYSTNRLRDMATASKWVKYLIHNIKMWNHHRTPINAEYFEGMNGGYMYSIGLMALNQEKASLGLQMVYPPNDSSNPVDALMAEKRVDQAVKSKLKPKAKVVKAKKKGKKKTTSSTKQVAAETPAPKKPSPKKEVTSEKVKKAAPKKPSSPKTPKAPAKAPKTSPKAPVKKSTLAQKEASPSPSGAPL